MKITDLFILAATLYLEAGSTLPSEETMAIGWVIKNRTKSKKFPSTIKAVCIQPKQFSCWNNKTPGQISLRTMQTNRFYICAAVAEIVLRSAAKWNPIPGALYYYNPQLCCPKWARKMKRVYTSSNLTHIFLKE